MIDISTPSGLISLTKVVLHTERPPDWAAYISIEIVPVLQKPACNTDVKYFSRQQSRYRVS